MRRRAGEPAGETGRLLELAERCREMTPEILAQVQEVLRSGKGAEVVRAAELLLAYGWGKAPQTVEMHHTGEVEANLFDPAKRQEIVDEAVKRLGTGGAGTGQLRE